MDNYRCVEKIMTVINEHKNLSKVRTVLKAEIIEFTKHDNVSNDLTDAYNLNTDLEYASVFLNHIQRVYGTLINRLDENALMHTKMIDKLIVIPQWHMLILGFVCRV